MSNGDGHLCPVILDGGTESAMCAEGFEYGTCFSLWAQEHRELLLNLQKGFIEAGSEIILTPTFGANPIHLTMDATEMKCGYYNRLLAEITVQAVRESGRKVTIAGDIGPTGTLVEPFAEVTFEQKISAYNVQVEALNPYVDMFFIETMTAMSDMRAAFIACKETGKPVFVSIMVDDDSVTDELEIPAVTAAVTMQAMGADAFGFNCSSHENIINALKDVIPYTDLPLIAKPCYLNVDKNGDEECISQEEAIRFNRELLSLGVKYIGGCCGSTPEDIEDIKKLVSEENKVESGFKKADTSLVFTHLNDIYFLAPDTTEISEPISCLPDMEETITAACEQAVDVLRVEVNSVDEAVDFARNAHMSTLPVMFLSESEAALDEALLLYQGRALVDSTSAIPEERLKQIADKYGAVVY